MRKLETPSDPAGLDLNDLLVVLFKHKWKLVLSLLLGILAATGYYLAFPPPYVSQAKLLVRYVVDKSSVDPIESQVKTTGSFFSETLINAEVEILTSWDLVEKVVEAITVEKLLPGGGPNATKAAAARGIRTALAVATSKGSNVLLVSYKNADPELSVRVLTELITRYFDKHLEVHRSSGTFDFVTQQTDQVRSRLNQTEEELKRLKAKSGIISLVESAATLDAQVENSQKTLYAVEAERVEQIARVKELERLSAGNDASQPGETLPAVNEKEQQTYRALLGDLDLLRRMRLDLASRYTPESRLVILNKTQIESLEAQCRELEKQAPGLLSAVPAANSPRALPPDLLTEKTRLAAVIAKTETLKAQVLEIQKQVGQFTEVRTQIAQLERKKEVDEKNYMYFESSLEKARIDEALDPSKMPNISVVQKPSLALKASMGVFKVMFVLAAGVFGLGLVYAAVTELVLNRSVKGSVELEKILKAPVLARIPDFATKVKARRPVQKEGEGAAAASPNLAPWEPDHFIRPFAETIRDRLLLHFQLNQIEHKPKLVGVTGCSEGAGISTLASGLASSLSDTGNGKVLLVDMNEGHAEVHPFFEGRPTCSLTDAIQTNGQIPSVDNLFLATAASPGAEPRQLMPKKLYELMPSLKKSDFDYVIFDMPPLDQGSVTLATAGAMDKVLLIIEAEKTNREVVKRTYAELLAARAHVSGVFNRSRSYLPKCFGAEV